MSNFINDRIKEFENKFPEMLLMDAGNSVPQELKDFLNSSLMCLLEKIEKGLPTNLYRDGLSDEELLFSQGYDDCLSKIQTLLKSYKQSL